MTRLTAGFALVLGSTSLFACSYCDPGSLKISTLRQEGRSAKLIAVVRPANPRLVGEQGVTDLVVERLLKNSSGQADPKQFLLNRWMPVDPKKPAHLLVFVDVTPQFDPYRGLPLKGAGVGDYLQQAMKLDDQDRPACLTFYFAHLDAADPDVAADAFLEFAKATDREIADVCRHLEPKKVRKLLADPKTPVERLGLFGYLLGATGDAADAAALAKMVREADAATAPALSGLLGGLIALDPKTGWATTVGLIADDKTPYQHKLAAMGTLRFFQTCQPKAHRADILAGMKAVVQRGDMADMAVEDLRRWGWWDLTAVVLAQYGKPTHAAPLVKNAILRYAITCRDEPSLALVRAARLADATLVADIEESYPRSEARPRAAPSHERPLPVHAPRLTPVSSRCRLAHRPRYSREARRRRGVERCPGRRHRTARRTRRLYRETSRTPAVASARRHPGEAFAVGGGRVI